MRSANRTLLQLLMTCVACAVVHAAPGTQPAELAKPLDISDTVRPILARHHPPGLIGAIVDLDGATAIGAAGVRKFGSPAPFTTGDQIHLGSDTKAMTAVLIAQLVDAGQLSYDTTLAQAFPGLAARMNASFAAVTVEQLLNHRGGLPANVDWAKYAREPVGIAAQRRMIVTDVLSAAPDSPPGSKYAYSNVGYMVLGAIVEAKTKQSWEDAIRTRLFGPLHMPSAEFGPPGTRGKLDQPWGHVANAAGQLTPVQIDNPSPLGPAGTVHCTMLDWSRFIALLLRSARQDTPLLSQKASARLLTPLEGSTYAGGWILAERPWAGGRAWTHAGSNTTWYCVAWLAPERGFAVLSAANAADADAQHACDELCAFLIEYRTRTAASQPAR